MDRLRPIPFYRLASKKRSSAKNWQLGILLAFTAGYINAGGLFIVNRYTSHMTGIMSEAADGLALGELRQALLLTGFVFCFIAGAAATTVLVLWAKRFAMHAQFSLPLLVEAAWLVLIILLYFADAGADWLVPFTVASLCFLMGLQNALITKASTAVVRTTHITGMSTDIGIELGRLIIGSDRTGQAASVTKVTLLAVVTMSFFLGGVIGAVLIGNSGAIGLVPVILLLALVSLPALYQDARTAQRRNRRMKRQAADPTG